MNEKEIKKRFLSVDHPVVPDESKKQETMKILEQAISEKEIRKNSSIKEAVFTQMKYMDKGIICIQCICFLLLLPLWFWVQDKMKSEGDYLVFGSVFAALIGIFIVSGIEKQYALNFQELEETCYFNVRQVTVLRMILLGGTDLLLLFFMTLVVASGSSRNLVETGVYLLVPFVVSCCGYFGVLMTETGRRNRFLLLGTGAFMAIVFTFVAGYPRFYEPSAFLFWYAVLLLGVMTMVLELWWIFYRVLKGEFICTD